MVRVYEPFNILFNMMHVHPYDETDTGESNGNMELATFSFISVQLSEKLDPSV